MYNKIFKYLIETILISENQTGFKPRDSCINQLLSLSKNICNAFDKGFEVKYIASLIFQIHSIKYDMKI